MDKPASDITMNSFAEVSFSGNQAATPVAVKGAFVKAVVQNAACQTSLYNFVFADNRLTYQGADGNFNAFVLALAAHDGQTITRELRLSIYKNGIAIGQAYGKVSSSGTILFKPVNFSAVLALTKGDYLEAMVSNGDGTEGILVSNLKLSLISKS